MKLQYIKCDMSAGHLVHGNGEAVLRHEKRVIFEVQNNSQLL